VFEQTSAPAYPLHSYAREKAEDELERSYNVTQGGFEMTQARTVVPFHRPARRRRVDLPLALAVLRNAVRAHERACVRQRLLLLAVPRQSLGQDAHAKPLGA
jgi:hypothetical protein